jgi:hypothetical protein
MMFERGAHTFASRAADGSVRDTAGRQWRVTADALVSDAGDRLARVPTHRAFWFGWAAQYPQTDLHK